MKILDLKAWDLRFPTSQGRHGSDAMNPDPDYSAAYVVLEAEGALQGHGLAFTIGRGNDLVVQAIRELGRFLQGISLETFKADPLRVWRTLTADSQLRWLGPEKGVVHMAAAALVNALWDLWARSEGKPLWQLLSDLPPERIVAAAEFRYVTDALTPQEALDLLEKACEGKEEREALLREQGYPAYTTSAGWLGYRDEEVLRRCREAKAHGFRAFKVKVGRVLEDDLRRLSLLRSELGPEGVLMADANQVWEVAEAIEWTRALAPFGLLWIEEPTHPDDVLGHRIIAEALAPLGIRVATGEHVANRVLFKQLLASGAIGFCQLDAARLAGINEILTVLLLAAKYRVPVCPHAGGVVCRSTCST